MSRPSPFDIVLTEDEEARLQQIARKYTSPYCDVVRAKAILLAAQGWTNQEISEQIDLPRQIVSKWRKRFWQERLDGLQDRPRRGRPGIFSPGDRRPRQGPGL